MKYQFLARLAFSAVCLAAVLFGSGIAAQAYPQGDGPAPMAGGNPGFAYRGLLEKDGSPFKGACTFTFSLWDAPTGGLQLGSNRVIPDLAVDNGIFSTVLNQDNEFGGQTPDVLDRWLAVSVQCPGDFAPVALGRQKLAASSYRLTPAAGK